MRKRKWKENKREFGKIDIDKVNKFAYENYKDFSKPTGGKYIDQCGCLVFCSHYSHDYHKMKIKKIHKGPIDRKVLEQFYNILDLEEISKAIVHMSRMYRFTDGAYPDNNKDVYQILYYKLYELTLKEENEFLFKGNIQKIDLVSYNRDDKKQTIKIDKLGNVTLNRKKFNIDIKKVNYLFKILKNIFSQRFINNFSCDKYGWKLKIYNEDGEKYEYVSIDPLFYKFLSLTDILEKTLDQKNLIGFSGDNKDKIKNIQIVMNVDNVEEKVYFNLENNTILYNDNIIKLSIGTFNKLMKIDYNEIIYYSPLYKYCEEYDRYKINFNFEKYGKISLSDKNIMSCYSQKIKDGLSLTIYLSNFNVFLLELDKILKKYKIPTNLYGKYLKEERKKISIDK